MKVEDRIRDVLARLLTLSETSAASLQPRTTKSAASSRVPRGVAETRNLSTPSDRDRPPSKEQSLHDWWHWRFTKAIEDGESEFELFRLVLLAERDYAARVYHSPDRMALRSGKTAGREVLIYACPRDDCSQWSEIKPHSVAPVCKGNRGNGRPGHEPVEMVEAAAGDRAEEAAAERVIELYEGVPAVEVAVHEYTTEDWVKKARRRLGRDPVDGRPRPPFLDLGEEDRFKEVAKLAARMGKKAAAKRLGVDPGTVRRYWPDAEPVAA